MSPRIAIDRHSLSALCQRWKIERMELFGSVLRDDFGPESDIDVLVTFAEDANWSLFAFVRCKEELEALFGRRVDLLTRPAVERSHNPYRRNAILSSAEAIYGP
jgi:predicted nucleotidyltransferase